MGIRYTLAYETSTAADLPTNSAKTINQGINFAGGPVDEILIRYDMTVATGSVDGDFGSCMDAVRFVMNGSTIFDYRAGYTDTSAATASQFGYFLNSLGAGRFVEEPSDTAKSATFRIPVGRQAPDGVSRLEWTIGYAAFQAATTSGTMQVWLRYNSNMTNTTTVGSATSFSHAASEETVVIRVPANTPGTIAGVLVENDSAADQLTGIRVVSQSDYSIPTSLWKALNGDTYNGVLYSVDGTSTTELQFAQTCPGGLFVPLLGLSMNADIIFQVNSSAVTTRLYTPVITAPIGASEKPSQVQTTPVPTNVSAAVLSKAEYGTS